MTTTVANKVAFNSNHSEQSVDCFEEEKDLGIPYEMSRAVMAISSNSHHNATTPTTIGSTETTTTAADADSKLLADLKKPYYCGFGPFHPKWLQIFANKKVFTFLMCLYVIIQGSIVSGVVSVIISTLERRYSFSSTLAGVLAGTYDFIIVIGVIFVSYIGGKVHKPRCMGISLIILSIGNFIMASPQFIFGTYKVGSEADKRYEECHVFDEEDTSYDDCSSANFGAYAILLVGQLTIGIGSAAAYTVAVAYIDEIVYPKFVSLHIGTMLLFSVVGPAIGYLLGSSLLSIYVDPWVDTELTPTNQNWVGAWWLAFIIMGALGLVVSVFLLMFPKWLPDSHLVRAERAKEMAKVHSSQFANEDTLTLLVKEFPIQIKNLLTNVSFMFTSFALAMIFVVRDGIVTFGPKYIESMFRVTATVAGLLAGGIGITAAALGVACGALIIYLWKPKGRYTAVIQFVVIVAGTPFVLLFLFKCPSYNVAGIVVPYADGSLNGRDSSNCSMNCNCSSSLFEPVCGNDGITYFSPCRAGCDRREIDNEYIFENCTCVGESFTLSSSNGVVSANDTAVEGLCSTDCNQLIPFMIIIFILVFLLLIIEIPYYNYTLRVVSDDQRPLALGLQSAIFRIFGSIPGPLLFGAVVDAACVEWEYNCGVRGNCWIYDNIKLSRNAILLCIPFAVLSAILLLMALITYPANKRIEDVVIDEKKINGDERVIENGSSIPNNKLPPETLSV